MDANLILHLPFDDPDGNKACDFTQYRNDALLSNGASFSKDGKIGKSITFNVTGECTTDRAIPISGDFTLSLWIKSKESKLGWLLAMPGVDNYKEQWFDVLPGEWNFFAFIKDGNKFIVYKNDSRIFDDVLPNTPNGFSINDYSLFGTKAEIDDVKLFNRAMKPREVFELQKETDVEYYIDGKNFKEYGVYVSNSAGLVGGLERKESLQVEWDNYHGIVRDKKRPRYKERTITLDCFIEASGRSALSALASCLEFSPFEVLSPLPPHAVIDNAITETMAVAITRFTFSISFLFLLAFVNIFQSPTPALMTMDHLVFYEFPPKCNLSRI